MRNDPEGPTGAEAVAQARMWRASASGHRRRRLAVSDVTGRQEKAGATC